MIQGLRVALTVFPAVLVVLVSTLVHQATGASVFVGATVFLLVPLVFGFLARFLARFMDGATVYGAVVNALASVRQWISAGSERICQLFPGWMPKMRNRIIAFFFPFCSVGLICIELILAAPECLHQWCMMLVMLLLAYTAWHSATRAMCQEIANRKQQLQTDESTQSEVHVEEKTRQNTEISEEAAGGWRPIESSTA